MYKNFTKYEIYEDGQIWSYKSNKFLKPKINKKGYQFVKLSDNEGKMKTYSVHRIVWEAVTGNPIPDGMQVNHIDEDKTNNHINNLNLMTCKENVNFGTGIERRSKALTNGVRSKQVGAYKDGKLVMVFPSTMEVQRQGFNRGNVSACCRGERNTHKGYNWRYL